MDNLTNIATIKDILSRYGFTFSKSLGQNFIINPSVCPKMADYSVDSEKGVIEIGPGIGVLTNELCKRAKKVVAIELDKRLLPVLDETLAEYDNVKIISGDVMKLDLAKIINDEFHNMDVVVCANLPYYITSPIIMKLLEDRLDIQSITVMVQKEAANRICAEVGTRESGAVTVAVNYYCDAEKLFDVSSGSFMPMPKVDSSVIKLKLKNEKVNIKDEKTFFKVVKAAFSQRRKTLLNSLSSGLNMSKEEIRNILVKTEINPEIRAEKLTLDDFVRITNNI